MRCENGCNCCIKVEDSIVIILCGEFEIDGLNTALNTVLGLKGKKSTDNWL